MFKLLKNKKGQGMFTSYTILFAIVGGLSIGMTVYIRRAVQGRYHDAKHYMHSVANEAYSNPSYGLQGNLEGTYEPYYRRDRTVKALDAVITERLIESSSDSAGIYRAEYDQRSVAQMTKNELPVNAAD